MSRMLADSLLMRDMLVAGGANGGKYGQAMAIWDKLINASEILRAPEPEQEAGPWDDWSHKKILHRLALGTALEFAVPVKYMNVDRCLPSCAEHEPHLGSIGCQGVTAVIYGCEWWG